MKPPLHFEQEIFLPYIILDLIKNSGGYINEFDLFRCFKLSRQVSLT